MYRKLTMILLALACACSCKPEKDKIRPSGNVILMVPDGTSSSVLSVLRWYREYMNPQDGKASLSFDPYLCGYVRQFCSDGAVAESSAAITSFMTGYRVQGPNICVYPQAHPGQDIIKVNPDSTWQPLATVLEAAKIVKDKSTGLVVTVRANHATPAGTCSHVVSRADNDIITEQMASNRVDLVFGGGTRYITDSVKSILSDNGTKYIEDDIEGFRALKDRKVWALFTKNYLSYEIDRDTTKQPSLSEMTAKAIELLSTDRNGFFLMVEGSKVDFAAHSNDPAGIISEFGEFEKAVGVALDFAKENGNTTVIVVPDHGNCGMTIGDRKYKDYSAKGLDSVFIKLPYYKATSDRIAKAVRKCPKSEIRETFRTLTGIELKPQEESMLVEARDRIEGNYMNVSYSYNLQSAVCDILNAYNHIGYASGSHTAEDVFLAVYNPDGQRPEGWIEGTALAGYMASVLGLPMSLEELTSEIYVRQDVLFSGHEVAVDGEDDEPVLVVDGGKVKVPANRSWIIADGRKVQLKSVSVYVPQNKTFYISKEILKYL